MYSDTISIENLPPAVEPAGARRIILLLALSVGLMQTGFGLIYPIFGRRLSEFGAGVNAMGLMITAFAVTQFIMSPIAGALADRYGRRPLILVGLVGFVAVNLGFLAVQSVAGFIAVRAAEGFLVAGLFPAANAVVGDLMPEERRAQWVGILMGSSMAGFIFGPTLGGLMYDAWGFAAPFVISAALGALACVAAIRWVPETHTAAPAPRAAQTPKLSLRAMLPRPLYLFATLLACDFVVMFSWSFTEPQMVFHFYDNLGWATARFGEVIGVYGLALVLTQAGLGRLGDRLGRKLPILVGLALIGLFYFSLAFFSSFPLTLLFAAVSGIGEGLYVPALGALFLDITPETHRSRIMGIKASVGSAAGVIGPLAVAGLGGWLTAQQIFLIGGSLSVAAALAALPILLGTRGRHA